jgi:hypothetical protein
VVASRLADRVACLTLTSPARLNAMSRAMRTELTRLGLAPAGSDEPYGQARASGRGGCGGLLCGRPGSQLCERAVIPEDGAKSAGIMKAGRYQLP